MTTPMEVLEKKLDAGLQPSYDDLEASLAQCLQERNAYEKTTMDMTSWFSRLVHAYLAQDMESVKNTLGQFVAERVKLVPASANQVH